MGIQCELSRAVIPVDFCPSEMWRTKVCLSCRVGFPFWTMLATTTIDVYESPLPFFISAKEGHLVYPERKWQWPMRVIQSSFFSYLHEILWIGKYIVRCFILCVNLPSNHITFIPKNIYILYVTIPCWSVHFGPTFSHHMEGEERSVVCWTVAA